MNGLNIKVFGHALKPRDPKNPYRWECYCGAYGTAIPVLTTTGRDKARRNEHNDHKIEVLRKEGKLED